MKETKAKTQALPEGVSLELLKDNWKIAETEYRPAFRKAAVLDATDRGRLWEAIRAKFPKYQILPDTNHVSYIKNNIVAAIYSTGKSAQIQPTSKDDQEIVEHLNVALEYEWDTAQVARYQMLAGERAALLNIGITQVGWDNSILGGQNSNFYKGKLVLKNINPLKYMRDPYAEDLESSSFAMVWDDYHKSVIAANPNYAEAFKRYLATEASTAMDTQQVQQLTDKKDADARKVKDYYRVITHWVNVNGDIHEIHTIDNACILYVKEKIKPNTFPLVELYCNLPAGDLLGTSEPSRIFANSLAYNIMNSIVLTAEYKNQRPPRFVNTQSALNVDSFVRHGNEADYTFVVQGDSSKAVHYQQFPQPSAATQVMSNVLTNDIQTITGVDGRYTGRDTGSILTTGGIENMLDQVTLIDQPKLNNYEHYSRRLTHLILHNLLAYGQKRNYFVKNPKNNAWQSVTVDFPKVDTETVFNYTINISSELPKNKARIAQMANILMEKQLQYGSNGQVDWITPEEWLMMQDLPNREFMQQRMGVQRTQDYIDMTSQIIFQYASLVEQGVDPEEALVATADTLQSQRTDPMELNTIMQEI